MPYSKQKASAGDNYIVKEIPNGFQAMTLNAILRTLNKQENQIQSILDENQLLKGQVERVNKYADLLCDTFNNGSRDWRIGMNIKAAIKGNSNDTD